MTFINVNVKFHKYLGYSPIKDELDFIKLDKNGLVRARYSLKYYAVGNKNKTLNCLRYVYLRAI